MSDRIRLVLLDDSEIIGLLMKAQLDELGFDVRTATNLRDFDQLLRTFAPEIILTDVQMPDAEGDEICRVLKRKMTEAVPVVLFSSLPVPDLRRRAERAGADGWISKDEGPEALKRKLDELLAEVVF